MHDHEAPAGHTDNPLSRGVTAVLGPTNTGKTHLAIERMLGHESGLIGLPLRLLAREVYDTVTARIGAANVALITGEEKIKPPNPRYYVCTVEAMPRDLDVAFLAIDEIQLAADPERGHVFTRRMLHARGESETLLLGAATMKEAVRELLPGANIVSRPRLSKLSYAGQKKISRLPRRSAIITFTANDVYAIAELVRRQRGGAAVVLGALSPKTRNAQVELYQNGEVDFLIATDAIGMGLNLDVDHVAFASVYKFDGQGHRELTAAEIGQIAGRAGRHMNDGTFGVTGTVAPFGSELVSALEGHEFEPVKTLQWRNHELDFGSLEKLRESLRATPKHSKLSRARMVDDVIALETVSADKKVRALAVSPAAIRRLWDVCQVPDYRKVSTAAHANLVAQLYVHLMSDSGIIPEDWFAEQVRFADRTDGDIDTLANRIAHIRTWTFVSHRSDWLADPEHWQEQTRAIEDKLSDALHERLTQRFVDRRTSVLVKRLRDKEALNAEIMPDGDIHVERHFVGRLDGFIFTPDTSAAGIHGKAARHAASKVLMEELSERAARLAGADDNAFALTSSGRIEWEGAAVARLEKGKTALGPTVQLVVDEHLSAPDRERVSERIQRWLDAHITERLKPLIDLGSADDVTGLARGMAFRLTENLGVLKREDVADEVRALDQEARGQLRRYGVRFGAFNIYMPVLLKPAASDLILLLWALHAGDRHGLGVEELPAPPREGLTSAAADPALPEAFYRAAGFHHCGKRVVRIDMLERLADMIRPLVAWRPSDADETAPEGATGNGGFRVTPDMMSIVGCSGEDFASVLQTLGFRRERRRQPEGAPAENASAADKGQSELYAAPGEGAASQEASEPGRKHPPPESGNDGSAVSEAECGGFEEIWRPRRKRRQHKPRKTGDAVPARARGKAKHAAGRDGAKRGRKGAANPKPSKGKGEKDAINPDSPFAALKDLKRDLEERVKNEA